MCIRGGRGGPGAGAAEGYTPVTFLAPSRAGPPDLNIRTPIASPPPGPHPNVGITPSTVVRALP
jgi:hypothetical protein